MTLLNNEKARIVRVIIPDAILIAVSAVSIFGTFINICTTLFFGFGENFTSLKQLVAFIVLAIISLILGLGRKTTVSINININTEEKTLTADSIFTINIISKKGTKEYNLQSKNIKCIYGLPSKDITIRFVYKNHKYKIVISGNKMENSDKLVDTLKDLGVTTRIINENIRN